MKRRRSDQMEMDRGGGGVVRATPMTFHTPVDINPDGNAEAGPSSWMRDRPESRIHRRTRQSDECAICRQRQIERSSRRSRSTEGGWRMLSVLDGSEQEERSGERLWTSEQLETLQPPTSLETRRASEESRVRRRSRRRSIEVPADTASEETSISSTRSPLRIRSNLRYLISPLSFLPFLTTTFAAPPPLIPSNSPQIDVVPVITPTPTLNRRDVAYITTAITPTVLPTEVKVVPETRLPYVLTRADSGQWEKVESAWSLYGRQAGTVGGVLAPEETMPVEGSSGSSFAVESTLPKGWGQQSTRTSYYRVPLIAVASVVLAVAIVVGIVILVFNRRKAHRKAKRRADRLRRKAMAAAGLDDNNINGSAAEAAFKEKLTELEKQHRNKQRTDASHGGFARVKVKKWTRGMRRRKGNKAEDEAVIEVIREDDEAEGTPKPNVEAGGRSSGETLRTISDVLANGGSPDGDLDGEGSRTSSEGRRRDITDTTSPEESSNTTHTTIDDGTPPAIPPATATNTAGTTPAPYFPPAYRPASVHSGNGDSRGDRGVGGSNGASGGFGGMPTSSGAGGVGSGRRRRSSDSNNGDTEDDPPPGLPPTEKTRAPGYYPAPATAESEAALAVVSRAEGKSRMVDYDREAEDEERVRHIATDDKRVLERMRMGGSEPPNTHSPLGHPSPSEPPHLERAIDERSALGSGHEQGPSAPHVDIDDDGFERHDLESEAVGTDESVGQLHPDIPPPPRLQPLRSLRSRLTQVSAGGEPQPSDMAERERSVSERRMSEERRDDLETMAQLGELDLLPESEAGENWVQTQIHDTSSPSAPPTSLEMPSAPAPSAPPAPASAPVAPSAPPLEEDPEEEHGDGDDMDNADVDNDPSSSTTPDVQEGLVEVVPDAAQTSQGSTASARESPPRARPFFLPKYEP